MHQECSSKFGTTYITGACMNLGTGLSVGWCYNGMEPMCNTSSTIDIPNMYGGEAINCGNFPTDVSKCSAFGADVRKQSLTEMGKYIVESEGDYEHMCQQCIEYRSHDSSSSSSSSSSGGGSSCSTKYVYYDGRKKKYNCRCS